ncbi:hypothetical protein OHS59_05840 [Streptomyces sp. NBC_00414]|uniref:hypothetical protein n=1 Tax=Streptomyces sp. NBC_00414 TaxID=2975739 RepID=UPI002E1E0DA4
MTATTVPTDPDPDTAPDSAPDKSPDGAATWWRPVELLKPRWPTLLAVALVILTSVGGGSGDPADSVSAFGDALPLLPLLYVITHQIGRRRAAWPVLGLGLAFMVALGAQDLVSQPVALITLALAVLVWGAVRGTPHGRAAFGIQAAGTLAFGALALVGLAVDPDLGRYLVAAGWFFHGVWDFVHIRHSRLNKVVSPTFAEWCAVVDVLVAVQLLFLL